jgi:hypothetical protein
MSLKPPPRSYTYGSMGQNIELHAEEILKLEFEYARETAAQAQNDRTTVVNLYLILVGGVGSLLLAIPAFAQADQFNLPPQAIGLLFILIAVLGFLTLFKLIRLRQAWHESAVAMNQIKQYYLDHFYGLDAAFHWHMQSIPAHDKPWTITFILSLMVVLIDSAAFGGGIYLLALPFRLLALSLAVALTVLAFFFQAAFYQLQLGHSEGRALPEKAGDEKANEV